VVCVELFVYCEFVRFFAGFLVLKFGRFCVVENWPPDCVMHALFYIVKGCI